MSPSSYASPLPRPHSRTQSHPINAIGFHYVPSDRDGDRNSLSPNSRSPEISFGSSFDYSRNHDGTDMLLDGVSSLPMPGDVAIDSDSEDESSLGLILDRSATSSTVSLEPHERLDALQKANADLGRKLIEAERTLQVKLQEHDSELEEMQARLDELKSELTATKREEKELRAKEVCSKTSWHPERAVADFLSDLFLFLFLLSSLLHTVLSASLRLRWLRSKVKLQSCKRVLRMHVLLISPYRNSIKNSAVRV